MPDNLRESLDDFSRSTAELMRSFLDNYGIILALVIQKMLGNPGAVVPPVQAALAIPVAVGVVILLGFLMGLINGASIVVAVVICYYV